MKKIFTLCCLALAASSAFAQTYVNAESVEFDPVNNQWLVSNGTRMIADDGAGNLSFFGTGAAGFGSEIIGNTIFVSTGNTVVGYDLNSEAEVMSLNIPAAGFLNGMATNGVDTIYTTDFNNDTIYAIDVSNLNNPSETLIVTDTEQRPNGIIYDGANNRLLFTTWTSPARIKAVDLGSNAVSDITTTNVNLIDGIDRDSQGDYYVSSWTPDRITKYSSDFSSFETITTPAIDSPADIGIKTATNRLAIPVFDDVVFVDLEVLSIADSSADDFGFEISSNPVNQSTYLQFASAIPNEIQINLYDVQGKLVRTLFDEKEVTGIQKVLFAGLQLESGMYFVSLSTETGFNKTIQIIAN